MGFLPELDDKGFIKAVKIKKRWFKKKRRGVLKKKVLPKTYKEYIKSRFWRRRKLQYFQKHGKRCAICGSKYVALHHIKYGDYGKERDEHLIALCHKHHERFHSRYGVKGVMVSETHEFIATDVWEEEVENVFKNL